MIKESCNTCQHHVRFCKGLNQSTCHKRSPIDGKWPLAGGGERCDDYKANIDRIWLLAWNDGSAGKKCRANMDNV